MLAIGLQAPTAFQFVKRMCTVYKLPKEYEYALEKQITFVWCQSTQPISPSRAFTTDDHFSNTKSLIHEQVAGPNSKRADSKSRLHRLHSANHLRNLQVTPSSDVNVHGMNEPHWSLTGCTWYDPWPDRSTTFSKRRKQNTSESHGSSSSFKQRFYSSRWCRVQWRWWRGSATLWPKERKRIRWNEKREKRSF